MSSPLPLPLLSVLVWTPSVGALLLFLLPASASRLGRAVAWAVSSGVLVLSGLLIRLFEPGGTSAFQFVELRSWIPELGLSYELGLDALGLGVAAWVTLLTVPAIHLARGSRELALVLLAESLLLGLAVSRDGFLFVSFQGAALVAVAFLIEGDENARRRWLVYQLTGFVFFVGFALVCYRAALTQTGFPTAELARWRDLVVFPVEERWLFLLPGAGLAVAAPLVPFTGWLVPTVEHLSPPGRVMFLGGLVLVPPYALVRLALPVTAAGAASWVSVLALFALASIAFSVVAPYRGPRRRSFVPVVVGLQGVVLAGLLAGGGAASPGILQLGLVVGAAAIWSGLGKEPQESGRWRWVGLVFGAAVVFLAALGTPSFTTLAGGSRWIGATMAVGAGLMALRFVRAMAASETRLPAVLLLVPVLALWLWLVAAPGLWTAFGPPSPANVPPVPPVPPMNEEP